MLPINASYAEIAKEYKEDVDFTYDIISNLVPQLDFGQFEKLIRKWFASKYGLIEAFDGKLTIGINTNTILEGEDPARGSSYEYIFKSLYNDYFNSDGTICFNANAYLTEKKLNPIFKSLHTYVGSTDPLALGHKSRFVFKRNIDKFFSFDHAFRPDRYSTTNTVTVYLKDLFLELLSEEAIDVQTNLFDNKYKISKLIKCICPDTNTANNFDTMWSRFIQKYAINAGYITASIAPHAYLLMAEGNSWWSCHRIQKRGSCSDYMGEYAGGCLSYMTDPTTVICGKESDSPAKLNYEVEIPTLDWRCVAYVDATNGAAVFGRNYSDWNAAYAAVARSLVMHQLAKYLDVKPNWRKEDDDTGNLDEYESLHYQDVFREEDNFATHCKLTDIGKDCSTTFGSDVYCLVCGNSVYANNSFVCRDCRDHSDNYVKCNHCDHSYPVEFTTEVGGNIYCKHCGFKNFATCANPECGDEIFLPDGGYLCGRDNNSERMYFCRTCTNDSEALICNICGNASLADNMHAIWPSNDLVCVTCIERLETIEDCFACGRPSQVSRCHSLEGNIYCGPCWTILTENDEQEEQNAS